jgi:hypothetical protein
VELMHLICQNAMSENTCAVIMANPVVQMVTGLGSLLVVILAAYVVITLLHKLEG